MPCALHNLEQKKGISKKRLNETVANGQTGKQANILNEAEAEAERRKQTK